MIASTTPLSPKKFPPRKPFNIYKIISILWIIVTMTCIFNIFNGYPPYISNWIAVLPPINLAIEFWSKKDKEDE